MKLSGQATLHAAVPEVYAALNDPAMLVRTIPGCERLEQVGSDSYKATVTAGVASIKGTFNGEVRLADQEAPHSFTLHASGVGAPGTVSAVARVALADVGGGVTLLRYDADATIGGVIGGVGQRVITGVARKTAAEFFAAVDRELVGAALRPAPAGAALAGAAAPVSPAALPLPVGAASNGTGATPGEVFAATPGGASAPGVGGVWTRPAPVPDPGRQRMRDMLFGAVFGAAVALLGVLVGAIVARW